jgi:alpha-L-arabinofuranosidase
LLDGIPREDQVTVMNGIERAAIQAEAKRGSSGLKADDADFRVLGFGFQRRGLELRTLPLIRHSASARQPDPWASLGRSKVTKGLPPSALLGELFAMASKSISLSLAAAALLIAVAHCAAQAPNPSALIHAEPLNRGKLNPKLFGNFVEMLDDVVPGMWAEMLNDRSFEEVVPMRDAIYFDGSPDICDREWDRNDTWVFDADRPFRGSRSAKMTSSPDAAASLTQSGLSAKSGMAYAFSGYFRSDNPKLKAVASLKALLPDGKWMTIASAELAGFSEEWRKFSASMTSIGQSAQTVFELRVEGEGRLWADKLSLMPANNERGWRRDVVDAMKEIAPPIVRWGGSVIDPGKYRWKNGIGDRDLRDSFPNLAWGRSDSNDVGIDEFCQLCESLGAEPLICVSFADGPQNAADMVGYCNGDAQSEWGARRASNGHPAPYHVKYWQIGNEIQGDDANYLARIEDFLHAMKQADPTAAYLSSYPAQKLLDLAGKDLSFVCPHLYTREVATCEEKLSSVSRMIEATPGCENLKIAITEWNISGGDWGLMRAKQMTLESALLNAQCLHVFLRHCDKVEIATRSNMANSFGGATIETNPSGVLRRPCHYVMEMYRRRARPIPLKVDEAPPGLDVFACAAADGKSLTVFAVNSKDTAREWSLQCIGFDKPLHVVRAEALRDTRDALQLDVMNHWNAPDRVKTTPLKSWQDSLTLPPYSVSAIECESR